MAIFTSQHIKLGDIWPIDYLATMPNGETKRFRLKHRDSKKNITGTGLQFTSIDENDTNIYYAKLEIEPTQVFIGKKCYDSINEFCIIDYKGIPLLLKADKCKLGCTNLTWEQRREIIRKMKNRTKIFET